MNNKKDSSGFTNSIKTFITYGVGAFIGVLIVRLIKAIIFSKFKVLFIVNCGINLCTRISNNFANRINFFSHSLP